MWVRECVEKRKAVGPHTDAVHNRSEDYESKDY